jgi:hypothetical protein
LFAVIAVGVIVISAATRGQHHDEKPDAQSYIRSMGQDPSRVQRSVQAVQAAIGHAIRSPTEGNATRLAGAAQQAHDEINSIRASFATSNTSGSLGHAEVEVFTAANALKNAMGAVVAYTGNPNPATLAHMTSQYRTAVGEWNQGISTIWRIAQERGAPTV